MRTRIEINRPWLDVVLVLGIAVSVIILTIQLWSVPWGGYDYGYEPPQPIAFSHRLHSGDMKIGCLYCHPAARTAALAGVLSPSQCMNCHRFVQARLGAVQEEERTAQAEGRPPQRQFSVEIAKIYAALGLNQDQERVGPQEPIRWIRVHRLPDFVRFHHGSHWASGVTCQECHGVVEQMERVRQVQSLSMGWCVQCHRDWQGRLQGDRRLQPSLDCSGCHY
ncbi:MAG TPA: cytochrome c3 family protein [Acidobacteriota bacterium]|nr:cytochrome c3 family protein [Acidobacteriota bacterium]